jgi:transcriptional repressor NrdR
MKCPFCQQGDFAVIDSRSHEDGFPVRRRRVCRACKRRVTTVEMIEETPLKVVKKDKSREPFDPSKLRRGLERACYKRPVSDEQIDAIVRQLEEYVYARYFNNEVPSKELGELVMEHLQKIDQVAFVRFASVYREFKDVSDFVQEVQPMLRKAANGTRRKRGQDSEVGERHGG